jgi:hypothetical protein
MPAGSTYTPIATTTLGSAQSTVTFNSFSGYTDLKLIINGTNAGGANYNCFIKFNNDSGSNYSGTWINGNGTTASSGRDSNVTYARLGYTNASTPSVLIADIMNYSNSSTYKTYLSRPNDPAYLVWVIAGLWRNTAAITSITLYNEASANFNSGSTFTLYGIASA